jgi:chitodextrinase
MLCGGAQAQAAIGYVQSSWDNPQGSQAVSAAAFPGAQTAGNVNLVFVGWSDSSSSVSSITDTGGNVYTLALGPTRVSGSASQSVYIATNIAAAAANTVTVTFSASVLYPDVRIVEYSGVDTAHPLDGVAGASAPSAGVLDSGALTTTVPNDWIVMGNYIASGTTAESSGFQERLYDQDSQVVADALAAAAGTYHAVAGQFPTGFWIQQAVALRAATGTTDTQAPSAPGSPTATPVSPSQISLSWGASTDNVAVVAYLVERCAGSGCSNFTQIAVTTAASYADSGLANASAYTYRVRAADAAGNVSGYSSTAGASTASSTGGTSIAYVQSAWTSPATATLQSLVTTTYPGAQGSGNLNLVFIGWDDVSSTITAVTDSAGNTYTLAVGPAHSGTGGSQAVYAAKNIVAASAGANTVSVTFSTAVLYPDVRVMEYSGVDTTSPIDGTAVGTGNGAIEEGGALTTTVPNEWIVVGNAIESSTVSEATGFAERSYDIASQVTADQAIAGVGPVPILMEQWGPGWWVIQAVALRPAGSTGGGGGGGDTQAPSTPASLSATAASASEIDLTWGASTDNVGVTGYLLERCSGSGCTNFAQIATPTGTSYADTGLSASTTYIYRVRAQDAAANLSGYSNTTDAITSSNGGGGGGSDTQPPTAPSGLTADAVSGTEILLTWSASSDNVGVTGYQVERCLGSSCSSFAQIATPTAATLLDSDLSMSTSYTYRVLAVDAAGNLSSYSPIASATTTTVGDICD